MQVYIKHVVLPVTEQTIKEYTMGGGRKLDLHQRIYF